MESMRGPKRAAFPSRSCHRRLGGREVRDGSGKTGEMPRFSEGGCAGRLKIAVTKTPKPVAAFEAPIGGCI